MRLTAYVRKLERDSLWAVYFYFQCLLLNYFYFQCLLLNYFYGALLSVLDCTVTVNFFELP